MIKRLPAPFIRHLLHSYRTGQICARAAARELGLARSRFYELYADYLRAGAHGQTETWSPGLSGGDHHPEWSAPAVALATKLLSAKPPCSYSAVASELHRRLDFQTNRASVRRWAIENQLAPDTRYKTPPKPVKRWQARDYGALWQYDATPYAWLPGTTDKQVLLEILDDATRLNPGARLYPAETLLAHLDFLSRIFQAHGLPLVLYVDFHSFFPPTTRTPSPNSARPSTSTASNSAKPPRPKPKAKSNAATTTGRNASFPCWPPITLSNSPGPANSSPNSSLMPTNTNSTVNWARLPTRPTCKPSPKSDRSFVPPPTVRGGLTSGASKPACASATTAKSPPATSGTPSPHPHAPPSSAASALMGTSITSVRLPIPIPNPSSCSMSLSSDPVRFCSHTKFRF